MKPLVAEAMTDAVWTVSSLCADTCCVAVAFVDDVVLVRDDAATTLRFSRDEWAAFLGGVRLGEFDGPQALG